MIKYLKLEWYRNKKILYGMLFYLSVSIFFVYLSGYVFIGFWLITMYSAFLGMISSGVEEVKEEGFFELLPGKLEQRVSAKYFYAASTCFVFLLLESFLTVPFVFTKKISMAQELRYFSLSILFSFVLLALEYLFYYIVGKGKNAVIRIFSTIVPCLLFGVLLYYLQKPIQTLFLEGAKTFIKLKSYTDLLLILGGSLLLFTSNRISIVASKFRESI